MDAKTIKDNALLYALCVGLCMIFPIFAIGPAISLWIDGYKCRSVVVFLVLISVGVIRGIYIHIPIIDDFHGPNAYAPPY